MPEDIGGAYYELSQSMGTWLRPERESAEIDVPFTESLNAVFMSLRSFSGSPEWNRALPHFDASVLAAEQAAWNSTHRLSVRVDGDAGWADAWDNGGRNTGIGEIDGVLQEYDFIVAPASGSSDGHYTLESSRPLNLYAVHRELVDLQGFTSVSHESVGTNTLPTIAWRLDSAASVKPSLVMGVWHIDIGIGWGDCESACLQRHSFEFLALDSGVVTLWTDDGDPLPALLGE